MDINYLSIIIFISYKIYNLFIYFHLEFYIILLLKILYNTKK